jgi:hypothetical protein
MKHKKRNILEIFESRRCKDCGKKLKGKKSKRCYSCANIFRWSDDDYRKRVSRLISKAQKLQDISGRVRQDWQNLNERDRQHRMQGLHKGSGNHSDAQVRLKRLLGSGWLFEYPVGTGSGGIRKGMPSAYRLDLANPEKRINIEVDGTSHRYRNQSKKDKRRDRFLRRKGWRIIRIQNKDVWNLHSTDLAMQVKVGGFK